MDNNMQPFNPQPSNRPIDPQLPPAMDAPTPAQTEQPSPNFAAQPQQPQQSQQFEQQPQPAQTDPISHSPALHNTGVPLASPILVPTHFDGMKNPDLTPQTAPGVTSSSQTSPEQKAKTYMILSIVFGAFAFIGIILGIWSLVANITTSNKLATADAALNNADAIIAKVEADTGVTITSPDNVPAYNPVIGNIYISEWGIKFKIPDDLENVSYILDQKYRPQICFTGNKIGIKYFPAFADIDQNPGGLGCVTRVATSEGDTDKDTGISFGQKVYTYGEYNYFYTGPAAHFSQDAAEQGLEDTAVQIIKNMISNNISHYE
ncbi:hypothetical protein IKF94_02585 [Candidatus Saccharibacteria bacterium]|nr:hypothetical protein [Candidatus Saccharibacteria bacterium]